MVFDSRHGEDRLDGKGHHHAGLDREQAGRFQQADREVEILGVDRVGEGGEQVLAVGGHPRAPLDLLRPPQPFATTNAVLRVVADVTVAQRVGLFVFDETFLGVLADGLQEPVPGVETTEFRDHEGTVHQPSEQVEPGTASTGVPTQMASAASRVQPPANTARRASSRCWGSSSRS